MNIAPDHVQQTRAYGVDPDQRLTTQGLIDIAARRWRVILLAPAVCMALAVVYLARTPDSFMATAVLVMDTKHGPSTPSQLSQDPLIDPAVVDSQLEILKSEHIAGEVVDRLRLDDDPRFAGGAPGWRDQIAAWLAGQRIAPATDAERRVAAVGSVMQKVKITRTGHSYLAEIAATTQDPALCARIANAVADAYIQDQLDSSLKANQRTVAWMNQRVEDVKAQAQAAGDAEAQFGRVHANEIAAGDAGAIAQERQLAQAAETARSDYAALENRSLRLAQFIQQQSLPVTEARILTSAEPPLTKSAPKSSVILLLALVGGLVVGAALAALRESLDRKLRRPQQFRAELGLPVAGIVPLVRGGRGAAELASLFDARRPWCSATETLRGIKVAVDHNLRRSVGGVVIGIASPWPGEGKSTLAFNMGRLLSEVGARVLLIDADLKKPDLSVTLDGRAGPGLAEVVAGAASIEHCIVRAAVGFDLLGAGAGPPPLHPFDLLGSRRMQAALAEAQAAYDYVLVDLPSLLSSVDAQAVARFIDGFVLAAEYGRTTVDDVERALATSDSIAGRVVAVVLNKARGAEASPARVRRPRALVSA